MQANRPPLDFDPQRCRADFPILASSIHGGRVPLVYLDNAASTHCPRQVIETMTSVCNTSYANVHRGIHWLSERCTELYEGARDKVQRFVNARAREEVIFTRGTTESINLVARSWGDANVRAGDEILVTEMEHHSNLVPWHQLAQRTGAIIRAIAIDDNGELLLESLADVLTERTRLVAVMAVSNVLGTMNPIAEIVRRAHAVGAVVLVDAAQSAPHTVTDVQAWDADFVAFSGHKMLGPTGIGVLWGRQALLDAMPPFLGGGGMIRRVRIDGFEPAELPEKFEAGTPPIVPAIGLGAAIDYLRQFEFSTLHDHEQRLTKLTHQMLGEVNGVRILGPAPETKTGIVSFVVDPIHAHDIAQLLDRDGIAVRAGHHCTMPLHHRLGVVASVRASFYVYNTVDEIERLGESLRRARAVFRR